MPIRPNGLGGTSWRVPLAGFLFCTFRASFAALASSDMGQMTGLQLQVRWLVDRAEIAELLARYARCIDERDWAGLQGTYAEDGVMEHGSAAVGRDRVPELSERILTGVASSHHLVDDPSIDLVRYGFFKLLDFVRTFPEQRQPVPYHGDSGLRAAVSSHSKSLSCSSMRGSGYLSTLPPAGAKTRPPRGGTIRTARLRPL